LNTQECSLVPLISEDEKFHEEEPQINQVEMSQCQKQLLDLLSILDLLLTKDMEHLIFLLSQMCSTKPGPGDQIIA
jgi:hypothetical protein